MDTKVYNVKNRGAGVVVWKIPEKNIRRTFAPGEVKVISYEEIQTMLYQPGGQELVLNFLQLQSREALKELNLKVEPEYDMSEEDVIKVMTTGSLDQFLDTLDFAPEAILDLMKVLAVQLPLNDTRKREALKKKTGFDTDAAIKNAAADEEEEQVKEETPTRRVAEKAEGGRRVQMPAYNITSIQQ